MPNQRKISPESFLPFIMLVCYFFLFSNPSCLSLSFAWQGESDDADLSISGGCRLLRVSVLPKSWQQEEAAHPLRLCVQPPLQLRAQEICHCGRPKDICLWCCFHPGCFTSKNHCVFVCVFLNCLLEIRSLKDKRTSLCSQGVTRGLEKNASLGSGGIPTDVGPTAGTFRLSEEWFEFSPLMSNHYFHRTHNTHWDGPAWFSVQFSENYYSFWMKHWNLCS